MGFLLEITKLICYTEKTKEVEKMKIKYLGTAAAEAVPAPFCECEVCENARAKKGRNIRSRSQAMVDDSLMLDFCGDTFMHTLQHNIKLCYIDAFLITHNHYDHLYPEELFCIGEWASHMKVKKPLVFYGTKPTMDKILERAFMPEKLLQEKAMELREIKPFEPFFINNYKVTALKADHGGDIQAVFYMIEKDGKALLYAHDTGLFPQETLEYLKSVDVCFDLVSYDCTNGLLDWDNRSHMGITGNRIIKKALLDMGRVNEKTIHVVNHFSHNGLAGYDELKPIAEKDGFIVSYDGLELEF